MGLEQRSENFFIKGQGVNISLDFVDQVCPVTTTLPLGSHRQYAKEWPWLCFKKT